MSASREDLTNPAPHWLVGGGEMGDRIRSFNWAATSLGPPESWPPALRTVLPVLLANRFPLLLWWGPQYIQFYNDPYSPIPGKKHPTQALGVPVSECWSEIWDVLKPLIDTPFHGGPPTWNDDILLEINRHGFVEEGHFTIAYSPVPDETAPGGVGGVLATVHEITEKVIGERRVGILRDLSASIGVANSVKSACAIAGHTLEKHDKDIPFALLYLIDADGIHARLDGAAGLEVDPEFSPETVEVSETQTATNGWPLAEVKRTQMMQLVERIGERFGKIPSGPWSDPPDSAVVVPIPSSKANEVVALLIMGVSSRLRFDDRYRDFFQLVKSQVAATIAHAQAYENERERAEALAELDRAKTAFRLLLERERAARNEAENANRLKDEFLSTVSHELRTPLSAILGWTFLLREGALDPAMAQRAIEGLERNAHAQEKLVQDLLDVSRIVTGKLRLDLEQVNLSQVIASALDVARPSAKDKGVTIDSSGVPDLGTIWGDSSRLQQIFWNLLSNSIKFTPKGGQARLTVEQAPTHISISVIDTGTGIEGDFLPFIFERFRQADSSLSRRYGGLGLGLAIVRRLVELHGGTVSAQSAGVDKGATFTVCLPAGATPESLNNIVSRRITDTHATPSEISPVLTGVEVLLVEDFADAQEFLSTILERAGAHVTAVASAAEAWTALDGSRFDVMLSDIEMPVEDGYTLIRRIRQGAPNIAAIPAAALSAHARPEERDHALLDGFNMHIAKPVDPYTLIHSVARLAGRPETGLGTGTGT